MFCVVGTEEQKGGDGRGEVSTGVESESVVRRRRAIVTRRLVPLAGDPSIVFLLPTRAREGVDSYWRRHSMRVYFVPNEYYSSIAPRLLHVFYSYSPILDRSLQILRRFSFRPREITWCLFVALWWRRRGISSWVHYWQLVLRYCCVGLRNSLGSSCVFCFQSLMRCWTNSVRAHPRHVLSLSTQQIRLGKIRSQASLNEEYVQSVILKWRKATQLMSWLRFLWLVSPTLSPNWVLSTAGCAEKTYLYSPNAVQRSYGISKGSDISRGINASALRLLDGVSLVSTLSLWLKMRWRGTATKFCGFS